MSCEISVTSGELKAYRHKMKFNESGSSITRVTSSNPRVTSSILRVKSSNSWVTSSNPLVHLNQLINENSSKNP